MDAVRLVRRGGRRGQYALGAGEGAMCAVMAMDADKIEEVLKEFPDVGIANYNCPGQIVITGRTEGVKDAAVKLKEAGARRTMMLNVSGPFHSPMLASAGEELAKELEHTNLHPLSIPYMTNVTAQKVEDIEKTKDLLVRQVSSPVRWMQSMEAMIADGVDQFVEIGPGKTLAGFMKKINSEYKVCNISVWEDIEKAVAALKGE